MAPSMWDSSDRTISAVLGSTSGLMEKSTRVSGPETKCMDTECSYGKTQVGMKVSLSKTNAKVRAHFSIAMVVDMKETGKRENKTAKEH